MLWKLNSLNSTVYLLTCQYFERMEKKILPSDSRIAFCRLFIVRVKKICYEREGSRELLGCFLHCTLECLRPYVPTASFRLMVLWNKVECQCYNETNMPPCWFENATKNNIMINFVLHQVSLSLFSTNLIIKNNISFVKTVLKKL